MLIIEGPDLVGKTTLCHELIERLNETGPNIAYEYGHSGIPPSDWDYYWSYVKRMRPNIVQDRFYLSEVAYGTVARKKTRVTGKTMRLLQAQLRLVGAFTVVLTAPDGLIKDVYGRHEKEEDFSLDEILAVNHFFQGMLNRSDYYDIDYSMDACQYRTGWEGAYTVDEIVDLYLEVQKHLAGTAMEGRIDGAI